MKLVTTGLQYIVAVLLGLVMAVLPTGLVSWAVLPPDGPIGEGFIIYVHPASFLLCLCSRLCCSDGTT